MQIKYDYSRNYTNKIRDKSRIKLIIIHYTGMQSEIESVKRLKDSKSKVSCHYLIGRKGQIIQLVKDKYAAWHAGKSKWKKFSNLNNNSIGIELINKGHKYGYQNFSNKQISSLIRLCKNLKKKYLIDAENFLGHSDIAPLRKIDPGEKFPWERLSKHNLGNWYKFDQNYEARDIKNKEVVFFKNLKTLGYRYFSIHKRKFKDKKIVRSFQRHYLPNNVTGEIDEKTLKISHVLTH